MKDFKLNAESGDILLEDGCIPLCEGDELTAQTLTRLLTTNKGEWWLNNREGVDFTAILTKNPNPDRVRGEIQKALLLADETLALESFSQQLRGRSLEIRFTLRRQQGKGLPLRLSYE